MNGIGLPRRQFLGQSGAPITSAAVLNSPLLTQAFAAQPGEEIIPWSDQPTVDPGVARGAIQTFPCWEDLDWLTPNSKFFNIAHYNRPHIEIFPALQVLDSASGDPRVGRRLIRPRNNFFSGLGGEGLRQQGAAQDGSTGDQGAALAQKLPPWHVDAVHDSLSRQSSAYC